MDDLERRALADLFVRDRVHGAHPTATDLTFDDPRAGFRSRGEDVRNLDGFLTSRGAEHRLHSAFASCSRYAARTVRLMRTSRDITEHCGNAARRRTVGLTRHS